MATTQQSYVLRWGVLGAGWIASMMCKDLVLDPAGRDVSDVAHSISAVASRDVAKAEKFIADFAPKGAWAQISGQVKELPVAVGSYEELVAREDVDIVYIATPHTKHFSAGKLALEAGKNVLIEKPCTLNAAESKYLIDLAKEKGCFFMEGVWTRFFPLAYKFQELAFNGAIGDVRQVFADFGMAFYGMLPESHRVFNAELAGGAQLDLGPYTMLWAILALYHHPKNNLGEPSRISSSMVPHPTTGVDLFSTMTLDFDNLVARANLTCNTVITTPADVCVRVVGTKGSLILPFATSRPTSIVLRTNTTDGPLAAEYKEETFDFPIQGFGLHWEADSVARSLRDGEKENPRMPHAETLLTMKLLDTWREQAGYKYPAGLEATL
ncbi:NAD-binding protein [Leucosporidium creatinivorum]|uniref:D-xylose 1-dehydrogenase (NADP(+), D-xylono-1,5-lactone-forming) n=1 Tax=Leucosporidium creatinivorum TaxID=106004 RepID=A0A1Y2G1H8_9BASI|nr:NAD-binding protein [Leucosporidium creatinivorum]